jgi:hypothetical protein
MERPAPSRIEHRAIGRRARPGIDLGLYDPLGREGQHLAHEVAIGRTPSVSAAM